MANITSNEVAPAAQPFFLPGNKTGVLLIHGYGGSIGDYRTFGHWLNHQGYTVYGLRLANHGQGVKALQHTTIDDMRRSVDEAIVKLAEHCNSMIIIGGSIGGCLALDAVHGHSNEALIKGVVLINAPIRFANDQILGAILKTGGFISPNFPKTIWRTAESRVREEMGSLSAWPIKGLQNIRQFLKYEFIPLIPKVKIPVLIFSSRSDRWVDIKSANYIMTRLGSVDKQIVKMTTKKHNCFRDPATFGQITEAVGQFIARLAK